MKWLNKNDDAVIKSDVFTNGKWKHFKINGGRTYRFRDSRDLLANFNEWNFYEF